MGPFVINSDIGNRRLGGAVKPSRESTETDFRSTLLAGLIAIAAAPALAQGNSAINRLGTVDNVDASSISLSSYKAVKTRCLSWHQMCWSCKLGQLTLPILSQMISLHLRLGLGRYGKLLFDRSPYLPGCHSRRRRRDSGR